MRVRRIVDVCVSVSLVVVAAIAYHRVFEGWSFLIRLGAAAVIGSALVALLTRGLMSRWWAGLVLVIAVLPLEVLLALNGTVRGGRPTTDTVDGLIDGLTDGWTSALGEFLPLADPSPITVLLVALTYGAAAATTALVLHTDRVVPTVLPGLALYAISLPLAAPGPTTSLALSASLTAATLVVILLRANPGADPSRAGTVVRADADYQPPRRLGRVLALGAPVVAVATIAGLALSPVVAGDRADEPFDPRDRRAADVDDRTLVNPLDEFRSVRQQEPAVSPFTVTVVGGGELVAGDHIRYAVFDTYDGRRWTASGHFERFDETLPGASERDPSAARLTVSLDGFDRRFGPFLPVMGEPRRIVGQSPVRYNPDTHTALAPVPMPASVVQTVDVWRVTEAERAKAGVDAEAATPELVAVPEGLPEELSTLSADIRAQTSDPVGQLDAIRRHLEEQAAYDEDAPSGTALGQLAEFVAGRQPGHEVHYAATVAVLARSLAIPARVVVGWPVPTDVDEAGATLEVSSADYSVWAEVPIAGRGWQAVTIALDDSGEPATVQSPGTTVPAGQLGGFRPTPEQAGPGQLLDEADPEPGSLPGWVIPTALAAFAVLWMTVFGALIVLAKRRRRHRRRHAATPAERILGAWTDSGDRLVEHGVAVHRQLTCGETVLAGSVQLGDDVVAALAEMAPEVRAAAYGAEPPTAEAAERAWALADEFRRDLRDTTGLVEANLARFDPRPLLRR